MYTGISYRTIHAQKQTLSVHDVFVTYMNNPNENLDPPQYLPSHIEGLKEKHDYFEVPDLETKLPRHDNPRCWLQQNVLQMKQVQLRLFQIIILNEDTIPQIIIVSNSY